MEAEEDPGPDPSLLPEEDGETATTALLPDDGETMVDREVEVGIVDAPGLGLDPAKWIREEMEEEGEDGDEVGPRLVEDR